MLHLLLLVAIDWPPDPADLRMFPPAEVCEWACRVNRELQTDLDLRLQYDPCDEYLLYVRRVNYQLWWLWDCLRCAHRGDERWHRELRCLLGEDAYLAGRMPPCVPLGLLPRGD